MSMQKSLSRLKKRKYLFLAVFILVLISAEYNSELRRVEKAFLKNLGLYELVYDFKTDSTKTNTDYACGEGLAIENVTKVTRVIDGDTIEIETGEKVRYIGIDTPETVHPNKDIECFGEEAKRRNEELVLGKKVYLESDVSGTDKYGRLTRYVWIIPEDTETTDSAQIMECGEMVNNTLIFEGFARVSTFPPDVKYVGLFTESEKQSRENKIGLWSSCE